MVLTVKLTHVLQDNRLEEPFVIPRDVFKLGLELDEGVFKVEWIAEDWVAENAVVKRAKSIKSYFVIMPYIALASYNTSL